MERGIRTRVSSWSLVCPRLNDLTKEMMAKIANGIARSWGGAKVRREWARESKGKNGAAKMTI